jgi:trehalose 6-phosphate synthase/phosphatase
VNQNNSNEPELPDEALYHLLDKFAQYDSVDVILMSSYDKDILDSWFGRFYFQIYAEHGIWKKTKTEGWQQTSGPLTNEWKNNIRPVLESYVDRTPGSYMEEMNHVLSWHFEKTDPDHGYLRACELKDELSERIINMDLQIREGRKVIEIKPAALNKGVATLQAFSAQTYDFIMAVGDQWTDESIFELLPDLAVTVRVGNRSTHARYNCESYEVDRKLLQQILDHE